MILGVYIMPVHYLSPFVSVFGTFDYCFSAGLGSGDGAEEKDGPSPTL